METSNVSNQFSSETIDKVKMVIDKFLSNLPKYVMVNKHKLNLVEENLADIFEWRGLDDWSIPPSYVSVHGLPSGVQPNVIIPFIALDWLVWMKVASDAGYKWEFEPIMSANKEVGRRILLWNTFENEGKMPFVVYYDMINQKIIDIWKKIDFDLLISVKLLKNALCFYATSITVRAPLCYEEFPEIVDTCVLDVIDMSYESLAKMLAM